MKTTSLIFFLLMISSFQLFGYDSGIAVVTEKGSHMQVYVNGKLYNKNPGSFVRVKSTPGLFHVEVRIMDTNTRKWYTVKKDIRAEKGFELKYKVVFRNSKPELVELQKYPIYSKYFLNPSLYNKHSVS